MHFHTLDSIFYEKGIIFAAWEFLFAPNGSLQIITDSCESKATFNGLFIDLCDWNEIKFEFINRDEKVKTIQTEMVFDANNVQHFFARLHCK